MPADVPDLEAIEELRRAIRLRREDRLATVSEFKERILAKRSRG